MFKKFFLPLFLIYIFQFDLFCQNNPGNIQLKIDSLMSSWNKENSPGAAVGVVKDGKLIFAKGYGCANLEYDIPITSQTVFHMASVSKQFTAFAIAMLADQGKLSLDDDIRKYLPEMPDFGKTITIKQLIHHTSGLRDQWNLLVLAGWRMDDVITKDHILKLMRNQKELNTAPGEEHNYCNTGYTFLAEIVSRISGKSFATWTKENIFEPLGMSNTLFYDDHELIVKNRAYSYYSSDNGFKKSNLNYANVGATSLFTTVEDMSKWALNFEQPTIGNKNILFQMQERGVIKNKDTITYAFGQVIYNHNGKKVFAHGGADAAYRTYFVRCPEEKLSVIVLSNLGEFDPGGIGTKILNIFIPGENKEPGPKEEKKELKEITVDPGIFKQYVGRYELEPGVIINIWTEEEKLMGQAAGQEKVQLFPKSETEYFLKVDDIQVDFEKNEQGEVYRLMLHMRGNNIPAMKLVESTNNVDLNDYTGEYYSDELQTSYKFVIDNDRLTARHIRHNDIAMTWREKDSFSGDAWFFGNIIFERDSNKKVVDCKISSGRVKNVLFVKTK